MGSLAGNCRKNENKTIRTLEIWGELYWIFLMIDLSSYKYDIQLTLNWINVIMLQCYLSYFWTLCFSDNQCRNQIYANLSILHFLIYIFVCSVRFIFCRAVLSLYSPTNGKEDFLPRCLPHLPESVAPESAAVQSVITQIADMFGSADRFVFPETKAHLKPGSEITKSEGNPSH